MPGAGKRVACSLAYQLVEAEFLGRPAEGVVLSCPRCGYRAEAVGTSREIILRCLAALREGCPCGGGSAHGIAPSVSVGEPTGRWRVG